MLRLVTQFHTCQSSVFFIADEANLTVAELSFASMCSLTHQRLSARAMTFPGWDTRNWRRRDSETRDVVCGDVTKVEIDWLPSTVVLSFCCSLDVAVKTALVTKTRFVCLSSSCNIRSIVFLDRDSVRTAGM